MRVTNYDWLEHNRYFMLHFHRARYGMYTLMELSSNKLVDFQCVHVSQAGNSNNMEKKGVFMKYQVMYR